jgi:hypothetical protein
VYDERLLGKYDGWRFDETDEIGLPENLDKKKGSRVWYTREDGLSRLILYRNLGLFSDGELLDSSYSYGRVVLVSGEATSRDSYVNELDTERKDRIAELESRFDVAKKEIDKGYKAALRKLGEGK